MRIVVVLAGLAFIAGGVLIVRNYEAVHSFFAERRRAMTGQRFESKYSRPEMMRFVGKWWITLGGLFVLIGLLHPAL